VWYAAIFVAGYLLLFLVAYLFLSWTLAHQDRHAIVSELKEFRGLYATGGMSAVQQDVAVDKHFGEESELLVRMADSDNKTLFVSAPEGWSDSDIVRLEKVIPRQTEEPAQVSLDRDHFIVDMVSTRLEDGTWLQVGIGTKEREQILDHFRHLFAGVMIPVLVLGVLSGSVLALRSLHPLRQLIRAVQSVEIGKMGSRVPSPRTEDELDELITLFNEMLGKIETLVSAMKASLDSVAHDLRTPMARLRGVAEMALQSGRDAAHYREALAECIEESERVLSMLNTLMDISEAETGVMELDRQRVDVAELVDGVVDLYAYAAQEKGTTIKTSVIGALDVMADRNRLAQVIANLLDNAIKYTPTGGEVNIEAESHVHDVAITVRDTGIGISPEELPRIWERLYRGSKGRTEKGIGLGLSLVRAVVQAHGGRIEVQSNPGQGSRFIISLPGAPHDPAEP
jgi:heavy metal sensor kinase